MKLQNLNFGICGSELRTRHSACFWVHGSLKVVAGGRREAASLDKNAASPKWSSPNRKFFKHSGSKHAGLCAKWDSMIMTHRFRSQFQESSCWSEAAAPPTISNAPPRGAAAAFAPFFIFGGKKIIGPWWALGFLATAMQQSQPADVMQTPGPSGSPQGWTKKVVPGKGVTKRRTVVFVSPEGERIKSKRQLELYLEGSPGGHTIADFDWSIGVDARRSSAKKRLSIETAEANENTQGNQVDSNALPPKRLQTEEHRALTEISNLKISKETESQFEKAPKFKGCISVKAALHLSTVPDTVLCRSDQIEKIVEFSKDCLLEQRSGNLYVCGCPGTGKSLAMEKVKFLTLEWTKEARILTPEVVSINCTTLTDARQIYHKILHVLQPNCADSNPSASLQHLKKALSFKQGSKKMQLLIIDEMDYLITREQSVLYDLFQLTISKGSSCILIGIANAIDLTERFLPRLRTLNCNPDVITFPAYSKDQILAVLNQRLSALPATAFHPLALELCARKVAAASGDMRKALHACRTAIDLIEVDAEEKSETVLQENMQIQVEHMAKALAKVFRSPVVETIQGLPQHSQIILCTAVRLFHTGKKDASLGELNKCYLGFCKTTGMHPVSSQEFFGMCQLIADQGLLSIGTAREDRLRKVKLQVDHVDVSFALQDVRIFRNNLL